MRMEQFTVKAQEAIAAAQTAAERADHPEVTPEHLLEALVSQEGGVVPAALGKMQVSAAATRGAPTPARRSGTRPSRSTGATSRRWRARASSIPSSPGTRRCAA